MRVEITKRMSEPPPPIASLPVTDQKALRDILRKAIDGVSAAVPTAAEASR